MSLRHEHGGYSFVELLVTVAIFSLAFVAIGAIFIGFTTAQGRAREGQRLLNEGNFLLESITREVRKNAIDYTCTEANPATTFNYICLRALDGTATHIRFESNDVKLCRGVDAAACISSFNSLVPTFITVTDLQFHTYPVKSPGAADAPESDVFQPSTLITLTVESGSGRAKEIYHLQTAVSSRVYNF